MLEKIAFLSLGLILLAILVVVLIMRPDLRRAAITMGCLGGTLGPIAELWYFKDYWQPPHLFPMVGTLTEDIIFGFAVGALVASAPKLVSGLRIAKQKRPKHLLQLIIFSATVPLQLQILVYWLGLSSIYASYLIFLVMIIGIMIQRPDLIKTMIIGGVTMFLLLYLLYTLSSLLVPEYLDKYAKFHDLILAINLPGGVPTTELIWYFLHAVAGSCLYEFANGYVLTKHLHSART